jgi:hypothetical protein
MPRTRSRFTLLLIFLLVVGVTRCLADCAAASCNPAGTAQMPQCHHHRQAPGHETPVHDTSAPCAPDVLLPGTVQPHPPQVSLFNASMPALAAPAIAVAQLTTAGRLSISRTSSRTKTSFLSSVVLRI